MKRPLSAALLLSALCLASAPGAALGNSASFRLPEEVFIPFGLTFGAAFHEDAPVGFLLGGEVSVVSVNQIDELYWIGGYTDFLWDFGQDKFRMSIGPEFGYGFFGVDAGYLLQFDGEGYDHGFVIRPVLTVGFVAFAVRYGHVFGVEKDANFGEVSALLKFPIPASGF